MAYCQHCGAQNAAGAFCGQCGRPLSPAQPQPQPQQPQAWQPPQQQAWQQPAAAQQPQWQQYQAPPKRSSAGLWIGLGGALVVVLAAAFFFLSGGGSTPAGGTGPTGGTSSSGGGGSQTSSSTKAVDSGMGFEYTTYGLGIPGAAYSEAAGDGKTRYVLSSGAKTKSTLRLNADGTYEWDSAWDGKIYKGKFEKTGDAGYPIRIRNAQEGKDWGIGPDTTKGAKPGTILVWNGSIWYVGYPLK